MNKPLSGVFCLIASLLCAQAQGPVDQSSLNPKPVRPEPAPPATVPVEKSPRPNPEGNKPINPDQPNLRIKAIVIVTARDQIKEAGLPSASGLDVQQVPFLNTPAFRHEMEPFLGDILTENRIRDLQDAIILYSRQHGKTLVDVILPEQDIENGVLQLWFLEGKVGKITVVNPGRKWFNDSLFLHTVRLYPGDEVNSKKLSEDLNWLNNNPFRQVDIAFKPGERLGLTDVELQVQDRIPFRPYFGYEDSGTRFTGPDRLLAGFNWGNAFGIDQQLNYQYTTDTGFDLVKAHSASYVIPLPWRHTITIFGTYVDGKADFGSSGTTAEGTSWQTSMRYSAPLPDVKSYRHQVSAGFDFKRSNNNLLSGGTNVLQHSETDVAQFVLGYSGAESDRHGSTSFSLEGYYSPGGFTDNNDDSSFNQLRSRSQANYFYGRLNAERIEGLPYGFAWVLKGWAQVANHRLLPSEQLGVGGYDSVRGYDERAANGDDGWIIRNELRTPAWSPPWHVGKVALGNLTGQENSRDELQLLAFFDYGAVRLIDVQQSDFIQSKSPNVNLYSVGGGLRYTMSRNFSLRFDYGVPLANQHLNGFRQGPRGHIGLLLSF